MEALFMPQAKLAAVAEHDYGEENFAPKYPVFKMSNSTEETPVDSASSSATGDTNKSTWL